MIAKWIRWSVANRLLVLGATLILVAWGGYAVHNIPVDALPDLSDVQVIVRTSFPGQAPEIVENQVTYPLEAALLSVPGAKIVRGFSFFGDSYVYVLFHDGTDLYWARSRVLEYLNQARLPAGATPSIGPDATGVDWIYEYALVDKTGRHDLAQLRSLQDWFLKFELKSLPDVAEVATIGGMVRQYQVVLDPERLAAYRVSVAQVIAALDRANQETGGSVLELAETSYMVRAAGYLRHLDDFKAIPLGVSATGTSVVLGDVAHVRLGPAPRQGVAELNGKGEVVGGVVILRAGKNARQVIQAVKDKLATLKSGLPAGVEIVPTYDRGILIDHAVNNLDDKLREELLVVALVCIVFLWHWRSAMVAIVALPIGVLIAFIIMYYQGINANIMSLGGIAIAIGAMVDASVVMIENAHKKMLAWQRTHPHENLQGDAHWQLVTEAATEVGPALFFSLLIIAFSFVPIFSLQAQEGRLFSPLAATKTYAMAAAAGLSVTLVPVLMGYWIRGRLPMEEKNWLNRWLVALYRPVLDWSLMHPKVMLSCALLLLMSSVWPMTHTGGEFMPPLNEGDLLYMPSALPGLSTEKAAALLQQSDALIKSVPEVASVFGKAGRAETATDPAPMEMFETTIHFKPRRQWRAGMTPKKLVAELDHVVRVPGLTNVWVPPIRNRIDMLATGIKSPIGIKISGDRLAELDAVAQAVEQVARRVPGVSSAFAERSNDGYYIDVTIHRALAARYGLNIADVQTMVSSAIGGENVGEVVDGVARYPINVRYPADYRDSLEKLRGMLMVSNSGQQLTLGTVASFVVHNGPAMIKSENVRPINWVYVDVRGRDLASVVDDLQHAVAKQVVLPAGVSLSYAGQFEYLARATARLEQVIPVTLLIIALLLFAVFRRIDDVLMVMLALPFALVGGFWLLYWLGYHQSVATTVGFIALAGVAAEFGVIMLLYLNQSVQARQKRDGVLTAEARLEAIREGALLRVRPKAMTVAAILAGLFPVMMGDGAGSEVMHRIAAPMLGGMLTAPILSMLVIPVLYRLRKRNIA